MGARKPYATPEDYAAWTGETAPVSPAQLRRAEIRVDEMLIGVVYDVDADANPTNENVVRALMEATCAQAVWFEETGDTAGVAAVIGGARIGSVSLPTPTSAAAGRGAALDTRFAPEADDVLRAAGLGTPTVRFAP